MGSAQSTHTTSEITELPQKQEALFSSVSGRKQSTDDIVLVEPYVISVLDDNADSDDSDYESDDGKSR